MSKYIKPETKGQIIFIILLVLAIVGGLIWNTIEENKTPPAWQTEYPMANASISWEQTFKGGSWNE